MAMTSVLPAQSSDIKPLLPADRSTAAMPQTQEPTPPHIKHEDDNDRGRPRSQSDDPDASDAEVDLGADGGHDDGDGNHANSSSEGHTRKRRRSRKGLDKKFECPEKGCGKSYSRAEHLYRHQLNHNPKTVYRCNFKDCDRTFVRLDLCNRHKDRHTAKGSVLNRKDSLMSQVSPIADTHPIYAGAGSASPETNRPGTAYNNGRRVPVQYHTSQDPMGSPYTPMVNTPPTGYSHASPPNGVDYGNHDHGYHHNQGQRPFHQSPPVLHQRPSIQTNVPHYGVLSPVSTQHGYQPTNTPQSTAALPFAPSQTFPAFSLPPSDFTTSATTNHRESERAYAPATSGEYAKHPHSQAPSEMILLDQMSMPATIPVFGNDSVLNKSPYVGMPEDFMAFLFNSPQQSDGSMTGVPMPAGYHNYGDFPNGTYYGTPSHLGYFPPSTGPQQVMSVTNLLDSNLPESIISEEKNIEIFEFIRERFHENGHAPFERQRDTIIDGDRNDDNHMLSRRMMQAYIGSYWLHFSDQVPIIHKPTFSPDKTHSLLFIAMMTIGAACLDRTHGPKVVKAGAQLSNFLAWHLRWEMFQDTNCRPPAKLWVFQTFLLLELYEKMYSTRELHERAHIHHATTITLMRRGRALVGKSATDSPPNLRDDKTGSRHSSTTSGMVSGTTQNPEEEYWNSWITNETTRRVAFAAFVIDSIHATMFGHSTVMVAHEMRLPLPCDDKLWKATSGAEVARIESNIMSSGGRPVSFLEGLKRTLSNQEVQTNSFGRTILMAGLLSVSWHMNQRDLQVNILGGGVSQALGGRDRWRGTLTRAFDSWKGDFDKSLRKNDSSDPYNYDPSTKIEANIVFESRIVLHHLAHMAMHVDIVDCQIFARAKRLLGRHIGTQDLASTQRRMKDVWAPSVKARDAAYYALQFLCSVLLTDGLRASQATGYDNGQPSELYSARDDVLLNRPWVLYFATLVVWCYGFALEGDCADVPSPASHPEAVDEMKRYLRQFCGLSTPEELKAIKGINRNTALMVVLKGIFQETRWELLHEGANLLDNCILLNAGKAVQ